MNFKYRYIARITVEAVTPLIIGSDALVSDQDKPVAKDFNNLPFIPGTAIAGFLNRASNNNELFGFVKGDTNNQPKGSNIITSDGYLLDSKSCVKQECVPFSTIESDEFLKHYTKLPLRQHTAINYLGASEDGSKYDEEFVYKGSRFKFEIALETSTDESVFWKSILQLIQTDNFYLGGGQFNNFGELEVKEIQAQTFNLDTDLDTYLETSVDLNEKLSDENININKELSVSELIIELDGSNSFFHFGSGLGDYEVDDANYKEFVIEGWGNGEGPKFDEKFIVSGTGIKGTLSHRTAFHFNKENDQTVEDLLDSTNSSLQNYLDNKDHLQNELPNTIEELQAEKQRIEHLLKEYSSATFNVDNLFKSVSGSNNIEIAELFGTAKNTDTKKGAIGKIIIKDIYLDKNTHEVIFNHNKLDRFTGGTIKTALFSEKALAINEVKLIIKGEKEAINNKYFQSALNDLKNGILPLGGKVNKGHGVFIEKK